MVAVSNTMLFHCKPFSVTRPDMKSGQLTENRPVGGVVRARFVSRAPTGFDRKRGFMEFLGCPLQGTDVMLLSARDPSSVRVRVRLPDTAPEVFTAPNLQSVCAHVDATHTPLSAAPQHVLDLLHRWTCCSRLNPLGKSCRQCGRPGPRQKRPSTPQAKGSPPVKARGVEGDEDDEEQPPAEISLPPALSKQLHHHCPFPQCVQFLGRGAGWMTPRELYLNINSVHLTCRQHPSPSFLTHYRRVVCHNCAVLIAAGKPGPACLNREWKTIRRPVHQPPPQPRPNTGVSAAEESLEGTPPFMPPSTLLVDDEFVPALPSLKQILSTSVTTLLHVPKILRAQWKTIFSGLLEDFLQTQTHEAFQKLLLVPKCLLCLLLYDEVLLEGEWYVLFGGAPALWPCAGE